MSDIIRYTYKKIKSIVVYTIGLHENTCIGCGKKNIMRKK